MTNQHDDFEVVDITPEIAEKYLGHNTHNRRTRQRVVNAYAADMANGDWRWNGEGIKFDVDGVLLDGQHRLLAIIESGVTIRMPVFHGLPRETQETMDGGAKRKFSDVLQLRGEPNYTTLAALLRRVHFWDTGYRRSPKGVTPPTNAQLLHTLERYPHLRQIAVDANRVAASCAFPASIIGLGWWLFERVAEDEPEDVTRFFERLADDTGHSKGEPIYELRRTAAQTKTVRGQRSDTYLTAILVKGWNAYRDGATVGLYRFRPGGANPEKFPEPR